MSAVKREDRVVKGRVYVRVEGRDEWSVEEGGPEKIRGVLGPPAAAAALKAAPDLVIWATQTKLPDGFTQIQAAVKPDLFQQLDHSSAADTGKIYFTVNVGPDGSVRSLYWEYVHLTNVGLALVTGAVENIVTGNASPVYAPQAIQ